MVFARRTVNHSPMETAIELDTDVETFRENVVNDLEASFQLLSVQRGLKTSENAEKIFDDRYNFIRELEEARVRKRIDELSKLYGELWIAAIRQQEEEEEAAAACRRHTSGGQPDGETTTLSCDDHHSQVQQRSDANGVKLEKTVEDRRESLVRNLRNWRERVAVERVQNKKLLDSLYKRKTKLRSERQHVNRIINIIAQIFDDSEEVTAPTASAPSAAGGKQRKKEAKK